jgi:hypothetical protein
VKTYDLKSAAKLLHMSPSALRQKAKTGEIPGSKPGKKWVFSDQNLRLFMQEQEELVAELAKRARRSASCLYTREAVSTGYESRRRRDADYASRLGLAIEEPHRNITTR